MFGILQLIGKVPVSYTHLGVLAVGFSPIINEKGRKSNPAEEAGINLGDVITAVNDQSISTDDQLAEMINAFGAKGEDCLLYTSSRRRYLVHSNYFFCPSQTKSS